MIVPGGGISLDGERWVVVPAQLLPAGARALASVPAAVPGEALRRSPCRRAAVLRQSRRARPIQRAFAAYLAPLRNIEWVVYCQAAVRRTRGRCCAISSRYTHRVAISNRRLISLDEQGRHLQVEGLPPRGPRAIQADDARHRRVHPPLPHPRAAQGLPPHPPLRPARQRLARRQHRTRPRAARRSKTEASPPMPLVDPNSRAVPAAAVA